MGIIDEQDVVVMSTFLCEELEEIGRGCVIRDMVQSGQKMRNKGVIAEK